MQAVMQLVAVLWPQTMQDMARWTAGYALLLADRPQGEVTAALRELATEGREWPPPPGVIVAKITRLERVAMVRSALAARTERKAVGA